MPPGPRVVNPSMGSQGCGESRYCCCLSHVPVSVGLSPSVDLGMPGCPSASSEPPSIATGCERASISLFTSANVAQGSARASERCSRAAEALCSGRPLSTSCTELCFGPAAPEACHRRGHERGSGCTRGEEMLEPPVEKL